MTQSLKGISLSPALAAWGFVVSVHLTPAQLLAGAIQPIQNAQAEVDWQARGYLNRSQQAFDDVPSQTQTQLVLTSAWQTDAWDLEISLPLISMDKGYQIQPGRTPNLCARIQGARPQKLNRWLASGRVNQKTIERCLAQESIDQNETVSGAGDARLDANRYWQIGDNLELSLGAGLKAANGSAEDNLGSGRESLALGGGLTYLWTNISAGVNGEYAQHLGTGEADEEDNNFNLLASLNWQWQPSMDIGLFSRWESASFTDEDDLTSAGLSLSYSPIKHLSLGFTFEQYQTNSQGLNHMVAGQISYRGF